MRETFTVAAPGFIQDHGSVVRSQGRQIDWANVPDSYKNGDGVKVLPAGTVVGDTLDAVANRGAVSPRVVTTNPAIGILETTAVEGESHAALSGYGVIIGGSIFGNLLPGGMPAAAVITELRAAGYAWHFATYSDVRL